MKLSVSQDAAKWYKKEMDLQQGDFLQFTIMLYGQSIHPNYSLGIAIESPQEMSIYTVVEGITFYFEKQDDWFLEEYHLSVTLANEDIDFIFERTK